MTPALLVIAFIAGFIRLMIAAWINPYRHEPTTHEDRMV